MRSKLAILDHDADSPRHDAPLSLRQLMGQQSLREYVAKIRRGLREPKTSGEYKFAIRQLLRVWSPIAALALPVLLMLAVMLTPNEMPPPVCVLIDVTTIEPDPIDPLDIVESKPTRQPDDDFQPVVIDSVDLPRATDDELAGEQIGPALDGESSPGFSDLPNIFKDVASIKSRISMPGMGNRALGARTKALGEYGGSKDGGAATERAVGLSLRWLKKYQEADGSWRTGAAGQANENGGAKPAMTGLALLTFLAHGETPDSREFGDTVKRAITWLIDNQLENGDFKGADEHNYCQPIATYALCEAFSLTRIPMVKTAAEKSVVRIVEGQNPGNLWNYNFDPKAQLKEGSSASDRNDLSYSGWCMQALKAASTAGLDVPGLSEAKRRAVLGIKANSLVSGDGTRAFGYTRVNDPWEITDAGALCLQLLGAGKSRELTESMLWLKQATCDWTKPWSQNPIYHWYYVTQVKFHAGGGAWNDWNRQFAPQLVQNQVVIKDAIADTNGVMADIGYWKPALEKEFCQSYVYNTTLCALMLQVYYRYLPTYKPVESVNEVPTSLSEANQDVEIQIL